MTTQSLNNSLTNLKEELVSIRSIAERISTKLEVIRIEAESCKIEVFQHCIEEQRKNIARDRGIASLIKDRKRGRNSLLVAAGSFILGGLLTRDKFGAVTAGMSGFDGMVQGFGKSKWCVSLGEKISVVAEETISQQVTWITLASFYKTMEELKRRALAGAKLGNLDDVISKLKKKPRLIQ